jgi:hypothetical protein
MAKAFSDTFAAPFGEQPGTLRGFLSSRKRELTSQVAALKGQILPLERELREIEIAIEALPPPAPTSLSDAALNYPINQGLSSAKMTFGLAELGRTVHERFKSMTIKELVVQALLDAFPNGASPAQIRDFIRDAYGREVEPASLRPQLHRLKSDGKLMVVTFGSGDTMWNLLPKARLLYSKYDHPTSRLAMKELLQDEPPAFDDPPAKD